jgi:riboflavin synthase
MFTGLVATCGTVVRVSPRGSGVEFVLHSNFTALERGESIACDGVCLTVESFENGTFQVLAGDETLRVTTLGSVRAGDSLHLERALRLGDRLGGHWVSGHVDGVGTVRSVTPGAEWTKIVVTAPPALRKHLVAKGSVCMAGVSLTVNEVDAEGFAVGIIPHTVGVTKLGALRPGDPVNLETDILAKHVERLLAFTRDEEDAGLSLAKLRAAGFSN